MLLWCIAATIAGTPAVSGAQPFQSLAAIDARAAAALEGSDQRARPVDRRLKLASCPVALTADKPVANAIAVRCEPLGWRVRVPIARVGGVSLGSPVIAKGDRVAVHMVGSGFSVTAPGTALEAADAGESLRVKIGQNAKPVTGVAVNTGNVRVAR